MAIRTAPGSTEGIRGRHKSFSKEVDWFERNIADLRRSYAGEFIAIKDRKVIGHDKKAADLLRGLRRDGVVLSDALIQRVIPEGVTYKL